MVHETKKILITVKAYPNPSRKYVETVCCAGIDIDTLHWIRLYPIPYRDLGNPKKFKKYDIIEVRCRKAEDSRKESYKVDSDSIKIIKHLDTSKNWDKRKKIVLPTLSKSFCQLKGKTTGNISLGAFKPVDVTFSYKKVTLDDTGKRSVPYAQLSFWNKRKKTIEQIPYKFYYHFKCANNYNCPSHKLLIIDWELGQSYRSWRSRYKSEELLMQKIREKWLGLMCSNDRDTCFFVGNQRRFRDEFMVLGVFYPKKAK